MKELRQGTPNMLADGNAGVTMDPFKHEFLKHYLSAGITSFSKRDIDALVMHLLDEYGFDGTGPLKKFSNQQVSIKLKASVSKIKSIRYEAALKYAEDGDARAKLKLLEILAQSTFDADAEKIGFIIEDTFTKNWLQGLLKENGLIFDNSFNSEIIKVEVDHLCLVLGKVYGEKSAYILKKRMEEAKAKKQKVDFAELKREFLKAAVATLGERVIGVPSVVIKGLLALVTG